MGPAQTSTASLVLMLTAGLTLAACQGSSGSASTSEPADAGQDTAGDAPDDDAVEDTDVEDVADAKDVADAEDAVDGPPPGALEFTVMTMNIGTTAGLPHDRAPDDGYTQQMADVADDLYENSLSWNPAEDALTAFLAEVRPAVVVFQEGFFDRWCEDIEVDPELDFVCQTWTPERPLQVQRLLGPDYQTACADGQEDNCLGVRTDFATIVGCPAGEVCLGGLAGEGVPDCANGARVGRATLELSDGRELVVVNVHGTSGITPGDQACRDGQFEQVFVDRGDGEPAAGGAHNLVMGDLNTDPTLFADADVSAATWNAHVGDGLPFWYISDTGEPFTYGDVANIDHVVSDTLRGGCVVPGVTDGAPPVLDAVYWDHKPVVCEVWWP